MIPQKPLKTKVSITLDQDIVDQLHILADEQDRSFSQCINLLLRNYLRAQKQEGDAGQKNA